MTQSSRTLFQRIRCIKSSLDKAEQSFMDNKDIRGELDLMLAEAELKNLRRKKDRPWSWNRQVLAGCAAVLLRRLVLCQKPLPREGAGRVAAACGRTCGQAGAENAGAGCGAQDCSYTETAS